MMTASRARGAITRAYAHSTTDGCDALAPLPRAIDGGCAYCGLPLMVRVVLPDITRSGYPIEAIALKDDRPDSLFAIVLCRLWDNDVTPWVTWGMNERGDTFWGHYARTRDEAMEDFAKRVWDR